MTILRYSLVGHALEHLECVQYREPHFRIPKALSFCRRQL